MAYLMDTHAYLWYALGDSRLSQTALDVIDDSDEDRLVSIASVWELSIKYSLGRIELTPSFAQLIPEILEINSLGVLGITTHHAVELSRLAYPRNGHRDPFDRMMIAQCIVEDVPFVSNDADLDEYPIRRIW